MKWRARMFYWSRQGGFLWRAALGLVGAGFVLAWMILLLNPKRSGQQGVDPVEQSLRTDWQRLERTTKPEPRQLSRWLRQLLTQMEHVCEVLEMKAPTWSDFQRDGRLAAYDARAVIAKNVTSIEQRGLIDDFIAARIEANEERRTQARERLVRLAEQPPPLPLANELLANLLLHEDKQALALETLMREGLAFPDAADSRTDALRLAVRLKAKERLQVMVRQVEWLNGASPLLRNQIGGLVNDPWMQWQALFQHRMQHVPYASVCLALFASGLWYVILVLHSQNGSWRWTGPILSLMAGVASVWPTLTMAAWQEMQMGWSSAVPFPNVLWYYILGVGLREELCKLLLFALFLPWLLRKRHPGAALLTGAFVGLGFALEENITYYQEFGSGVALARFLSANFLHAALTGVAGQSLYVMLRSRFAQAVPFLITFATAVSVHGVYDYVASDSASGLDLLAMILLAATAWQFFDLLAVEVPYAKQTVAPAAVFVLGLALITAVAMMHAATQATEFSTVVGVASQAVGMIPVALIYWRRFDPTPGRH